MNKQKATTNLVLVQNAIKKEESKRWWWSVTNLFIVAIWTIFSLSVGLPTMFVAVCITVLVSATAWGTHRRTTRINELKAELKELKEIVFIEPSTEQSTGE